jgi:ribosome-binding factor A
MEILTYNEVEMTGDLHFSKFFVSTFSLWKMFQQCFSSVDIKFTEI